MRRLWAFTIAGAFLAFGAVSAEAQMRLGAKGGVSFSTLSFDDDEIETESLTGFVGGAEVQIPLGAGGLVLQPELLFTRKGTEGTVFGFPSKVELDYVEIPVLLRFNIPAPSVMPFVYAGGVASFEAGCAGEVTIAGETDEFDCDDEDVEVDTESTDFGVLFGGGLAFAAGPGDIFIEGRYNFGLVDINAFEGEGNEAKNRSGAAMIGYSVSLDPTRR